MKVFLIIKLLSILAIFEKEVPIFRTTKEHSGTPLATKESMYACLKVNLTIVKFPSTKRSQAQMSSFT